MDVEFQQYIETGSVESMDSFLRENPIYANKKICWGEDQKNVSDPLHYVSACVFNGLLTNGREGEVATILLRHGAELNGSHGAESPLIGAASLSSVKVAQVLLEEGADTKLVSVFGATALHWAAYVGTPTIVSALLKKGVNPEKKCTEYGATPLFWAVQGFSKNGPPKKSDQIGSAKVLIDAGADIQTRNVNGISALARSTESESDSMSQVLTTAGAI